MIDRRDFIERIARAIQAGQRKRGRILDDAAAHRQAVQVADQLPALFKTGDIVLPRQTAS